MTLNDIDRSYTEDPWAGMEMLKDEIRILRNDRKLLEPYIKRVEEIDIALTERMDKFCILYELFKNEP